MSSSPWNHPCCVKCWRRIRGGDRLPYAVRGALERCCWCRTITAAGIYVRHDPKQLLCLGDHEPVQPRGGAA